MTNVDNVSSLPNNVANIDNVSLAKYMYYQQEILDLPILVVSVSNSNVYVCSININETRRKV